MQPYTEGFYKSHQEGSRRSAKEIIPLVLGLIHPKSVIDIGCGVGTWLSVFKEYGVEDIGGVDGDYVDRQLLEIPEERFLSWDLKKPLRMDRQFDLVVSLEVAEHLPHECAETFVDCLVRLGSVILFSAAIPFQGGTGHINEQWPDYWVNFFQGKEYVAIDCIRKRIWQNDNVEWWYAQNMLMFVRQDYVASHPLLQKEFEDTAISQLSLIHPKKYLDVIRLQLATQEIAALIPPGNTFILVDQEQFRSAVAVGHHVIPFLERNGHYWGPPPDSITAIRELERLRRFGAHFIVFGWPAFWWLDYYSALHSYLRSEFRCVLHNDRLVAFDLRP
jgi:SAM-dependent methyltransferase